MGDGMIDYITGEVLPYSRSGGLLLIPFGCDFSYWNAGKVYTAIDKMLEWMTLFYPDFHLKLSTPGKYIKALKKYQDDNYSRWPVTHEDGFPISGQYGRYWTGYFTTRPNLKRTVRIASA